MKNWRVNMCEQLGSNRLLGRSWPCIVADKVREQRVDLLAPQQRENLFKIQVRIRFRTSHDPVSHAATGLSANDESPPIRNECVRFRLQGLVDDEHNVVEALGIRGRLAPESRDGILRPLDLDADQSVADHGQIDAGATGTDLHLLDEERF